MGPRAKLSCENAPAEDIFGDLFRAQWPGLCGYVRRNFGPGPPEPEEVAQSAFAKLASYLRSGSVSNPAAFLRRTARNIVIDAHRHAIRNARFSANLRIIEEGVSESSPEDVLSTKEELAQVGAAIASLKPKQRVALMLHRVDGLSKTEVASRMGLSESYVRVLIDSGHRACVAALKARR